ncbi:MAG TPA: hypothetical protein VMC79_10930 [Rectinemataceae bacterium]|nr:hypothetical protein [Rectinemataceae bacterium]
MNYRIVAVAAAVIMCGAVVAQSQDNNPSEQRALDTARSAFWFGQQDQAEGARPYAPFVLAFVPGLQFPFGRYDTSFCAAYIGALTYDVNGMAAAGVFDLSRDVNGLQAAGVFGMAEKVHGLQASGVFSMARSLEGFQGAGVFNMVKDADSSFQGAGVFNIAGSINGVQVAGVFNVARTVKGAQIGVFNFADHIDGVQIGLINIARNGVAGLTLVYEPSTDYVFTYWQTGTPWLYTVIGASAPRNDWFYSADQALFSFGFGSRMGGRGLYLDADVSVEEPVGKLVDQGLSSGCSDSTNPWTTPYPSARLSVGIPLAGRVHLVGGLKLDIDLLDHPGVPLALKAGRPFSDTWFGVPFDAYANWFFGIRM